ncbi:quinolinate synthetase [Pustulibacterium marinum]|uniref:Quinolinate synthase n=1 Tax=Pustulibacterium marinum TaxID=1224947 RepID=A0A1I7F0F4_9FLAO|nr:quinolinate synthase NadA [Pustulibacterium marinum]SFU29638.1 quinolinate synthetase [Pustulibacterium marinum]
METHPNNADEHSKQNAQLADHILRLKKKKNAILLAHYYQEPAIQDIADFVGDSLELSQKAAETSAEIIIFAGVYFMAETAKILNPEKKVLVPDLEASCSLAESCKPEDFKKFINRYPYHKVVTYINCDASIKTMSDLVCTSSNAKKIINSFPEDQPIIFGPDKNLGAYLAKETGRDLVLWNGACIVHEAFALDKIIDLFKTYPHARLIAHPESPAQILEIASYIGSTSGMLNHVKENDSDTFIVATEAAILHKMQQEVPHKILIPAPAMADNSCACSECAFMKLNSLQKIYNCLVKETPEVTLNPETSEKALIPIQKMLSI